MKFLLPLFFVFQIQANYIGSFQECSDPAANVIYKQLPSGNQLFVTTINKINGKHKKLELKDYSITEDSSAFLESRNVLNCQENIVELNEDLVFRKIRIFNTSGAKFAGNIVGVSEDKTFIPVDYICKSTTLSDCL